MKNTYKSSSLTTIIKYFIAPLMVLLFLYTLFMIASGSDLGDFSLAELPIMAWAVVMSVASAIYFKNVEVTNQNIVIGRGLNKKILDYKNISWVAQTYIGRTAVYFKYSDPRIGQTQIISFIPEIYTETQFPKIMRHPYSELEVTDFMRTQVRITKGEYDAKAEPSQWAFLWLTLLSLLPFVLVSIWLMK
jgi:hypothetical protein